MNVFIQLFICYDAQFTLYVKADDSFTFILHYLKLSDFLSNAVHVYDFHCVSSNSQCQLFKKTCFFHRSKYTIGIAEFKERCCPPLCLRYDFYCIVCTL